jgi:hypothetical protein
VRAGTVAQCGSCPTDLKGQSQEIFDFWTFSSNNAPASTDSWAKAVSNNSQFYSHGVGKITYGSFFATVCFNCWYKSRNIGILTVQEKLRAMMIPPIWRIRLKDLVKMDSVVKFSAVASTGTAGDQLITSNGFGL